MTKIKDTTVFILCAGGGERWNNYMGIPKQLIRFNSETLIDRTVRLLRSENDNIEIFIVANDTLIQNNNAERLIPENSSCTVQTFLSTKKHWSDNNVILLGDVFYSQSAIRKILRNSRQVQFFGKVGKCKFGTKRNGEIYGFRFTSHDLIKIQYYSELILEYSLNGAIGNLWDLYHLLSELPFNSGRVDFKNFYCQNDYTDDFDTPADYEKFKSIYQNIAGGSSVKKLGLLIYLKLNEYILDWQSKRFRGYAEGDWNNDEYKNSAA